MKTPANVAPACDSNVSSVRHDSASTRAKTRAGDRHGPGIRHRPAIASNHASEARSPEAAHKVRYWLCGRN